MRQKKGFTLVEMLVVGAMGAVLLTSVTIILVSSARAANKSRLSKLIEENAAWLNFELKKNMMWARGDSLICPTGVGSSIGIENRYDGQPTVIGCIEDGGIASSSANGVELTGDEVWISNCDNFVSCDYGSSSLPRVDFNFRINAGRNTGNPEDFSQKDFQLSVSVRE